MAVFYKNIDLRLNELKNVVIDKIEASELPAEHRAGRVIYFIDSTASPVDEGNLYYSNGTEWVKWLVPDDAIDFQAGNGIELDDSVEGELTISAKLDPASHAALTLETEGIKLDTSQIVLNDLGNATDDYNMGGNTFTNLKTPESGDQAATKGYVDGLVASLGEFQGAHDFGTGSPAADEYPTESDREDSPVGAIKKGDYWRVTQKSVGPVGTGEVIAEVGDVLFAKVDDPGQTDSNWFLVQANIDYATETTSGYIRIATQAEVDAGTSTDPSKPSAVTPETLQQKINAVTAGDAKFHRETITGDNSETYTVSHNFSLDTPFTASVQVFDVVSGDQVFCDITFTANTIELDFNEVVDSETSFNVVVVGGNPAE